VDLRRFILSKKGRIVVSVTTTVMLMWVSVILSAACHLSLNFGGSTDLKFDLLRIYAYDIIPSPWRVEILDIAFSDSDTANFFVTAKNRRESSTSVDITKITVTSEGIVKEISGSFITPNLPYKLDINSMMNFTCSWDWADYRGKNATIAIFTAQNYVLRYIFNVAVPRSTLYPSNIKLMDFFDFFRALVAVSFIPLIIGGFISGTLNFEGQGWKSAGKSTLYSVIVFGVSLAMLANIAQTNATSLFGQATMIGLLLGEVFIVSSVTAFFYLPTGIAGFLAEKTFRLVLKDLTTPKTPKTPSKLPQAASTPSSKTPSLEIPKGYTMIRQLGGGGFADVVLAKGKKREVVLKIIRNADKEKAKAISEAQIQYKLGHKNIVEVYDLIMDPLCIVEEYCEGGNLLDQVSPKPLPEVIKLVLRTGMSIGTALWVIHNCGYIHLDIKPENILFKKEGKDFVPKLSDFGTAKALGSLVGGMTCTPQYLPQGYPLPIDTRDRRLDIYQLGLSLYFPLVACALRKSNLDIEKLKLNPVFLSTQCPEIVPEIDTVLHKAINVRGKDFSRAYQNAKEFADDIAKIKIK